jgi:hypothetical protein
VVSESFTEIDNEEDIALSEIALASDYDPDNITCKNCGKSGLKWKIDKETQKYQLMENRIKKHICEMFGGSGFGKKKFTKIIRYKKDGNSV